MKKIICVIVVLFFQIATIRAQFVDTLTVIELENGKPTSFSIAFVKKSAYLFYVSGSREQKIFYKEFINGMSRYIIKDDNGGYTMHLIKNSGKGYYFYFTSPSFDSLSNAKSYTPGIELFSHGFTLKQRSVYMKIVPQKSFSKEEALNFLSYKFNSFLALKSMCDNLIQHSDLKNNFKTSKELYSAVRGKFENQAYITWLNNKGLSGASYGSFSFDMELHAFDPTIMAKEVEYLAKEGAFYK